MAGPASHPVLDRIGGTPLLDLTRYARGLGMEGVAILAKFEGANPGGSVKDRPAIQMIRSAIGDGRLDRRKAILDSTSGNTGIAYALIGRCLDYEVHIVAPENMDEGRVAALAAYGAKIIFSSPFEGSDGAIRLCGKLHAETPELYFWPDQYNNPDNWRAHYYGTGPEIEAALGGRLTHFVAGIGTSGTLMGAGRYLRTRNPNLEVWAAEPDDGFHGIEGLKHMPSSIVPGLYEPSWLDGVLGADTEEAAVWADRLAADGLAVGRSSGCALAAALRLAARLPDEERARAVIATIFPDTLEKSVVDLARPFDADGGIRRGKAA